MRAAVVGPSAWPSPWFLMFQTFYLDMWRLPEVRPVGFHPRTHQGPHFRSTAATVENVGIGLARPRTVRIHRKTPSCTPGYTRTWLRLSRMRRLLPVEDNVDQHHPTGLCDVRESATCLLDGQGGEGWGSKPKWREAKRHFGLCIYIDWLINWLLYGISAQKGY